MGVRVPPADFARSQRASQLLITLDGTEERPKISFAEGKVIFPLNQLDKNRADQILRKDLKEVPLGVPIESIACIKSLDNGTITFVD